MRKSVPISALIGVIALASCASEPPTSAPTTEAPATTVVETTEAPTATEAPTTTVVELDEFKTWLLGQYPNILDLAGDMQNVGPLIDGGDIDGAASLSTQIGDAFLALYMEAPETDTKLANTTNEMLITCSLGYTAGGAAMSSMNVSDLNEATVTISTCGDLLSQSAELINS